MSRTKDWLMIIEDVAQEALNLNLEGKDAVDYMVSNFPDKSYGALRGCFEEVLRSVKERETLV
tara:strand:+ start:152 stop:340 length:189 start_codon:yes stop_codon:yes gene_type:complete